MLIGAHVSPAGGPANAVARGVERGCDAIQIFNQNPRAWKPTVYSDEQVADFREAMASSRVDALLIHAVYLLNAATTDKEMRAKTRASLIASLRAGRRPRRARRRPAPRQRPGRQGRPRRSSARARSSRRRWPRARTARCTWRTPRARAARSGARSRSSPTSSTPPVARRAWACAWTPATCSPPATTSAPRRASRRCSTSAPTLVGLDRLGSLHLNDSQTPLGSNRDRHADVGEGELGRRGCAVFLSEPRFDGLPCVLETPGPDRHGPTQGADHADASSTWPGSASAPLGRGMLRVHKGSAALRPRSPRRVVVHHRAQLKKGDPPPPVQR